MASRVQGGAAARPWWHNPDLDMAVEDIATFYREHTQKLSRLQKQKEKEKKKEIKKKQRKQRKRERGESTSKFMLLRNRWLRNGVLLLVEWRNTDVKFRFRFIVR